jgi:hypothetical protein
MERRLARLQRHWQANQSQQGHGMELGFEQQQGVHDAFV